MKISTIKSEGLASLSYFVVSRDEAVVIDPRRDVEVYTRLAERSEVAITHILETHRNEDYVIGSLELHSTFPESKIAHSKATSFKYGNINLDDQDTITVGDMLITCLNTPGHTDDSMCYVVADRSVSTDPIVAFTGDTLFVNSVGRTDLVDIKKHEDMSRKMYHSLHERLLKLPDGVVIRPGHGSGSVCGGDIGSREFSTIGFERKHNIWLSMEEDEFIQRKVKQRLTTASYFKHCEHLNTIGAPLLSEQPIAREVEIGEFETLLKQEKHRAIDIRSSLQFTVGHIPGTISLSIHNMGLLVGLALRPTQNFSIIFENNMDELKLAKAMLHRIGYDDIRGYLRNGIESWTKSGRELRSIESMSLEVFGAYQTRSELDIIDVREPHEFVEERIEGSRSIPLSDFGEEAATIDSDRFIATICPRGNRGTTAASILLREGKTDVKVSMDGLKAWKDQDFPLIHGSDE
ncbi:MAG: rhodanese-like domain-containing protein [Candidatus Thorarchaeota archaeon]